VHGQKREHPVVIKVVEPLAHHPVAGNIVPHVKPVSFFEIFEKTYQGSLILFIHGPENQLSAVFQGYILGITVKEHSEPHPSSAKITDT
jgi:hypothetical protein